jgi:hypothetical protein
MSTKPNPANVARMAEAMFEIVNDQNKDDVVRALIIVMTPMFVNVPEPRSGAVQYVLQLMETEILVRLPEVVELLTGHKH